MTEHEILAIVLLLAMILSFAIGAAFGATIAERNQKKLIELIHESQDKENPQSHVDTTK